MLFIEVRLWCGRGSFTTPATRSWYTFIASIPRSISPARYRPVGRRHQERYRLSWRRTDERLRLDVFRIYQTTAVPATGNRWRERTTCANDSPHRSRLKVLYGGCIIIRCGMNYLSNICQCAAGWTQLLSHRFSVRSGYGLLTADHTVYRPYESGLSSPRLGAYRCR